LKRNERFAEVRQRTRYARAFLTVARTHEIALQAQSRFMGDLLEIKDLAKR